METEAATGLALEATDLRAIRNRLRRAEGQLGAIIKKLDEDPDCLDLVTQIAACSKALDRAGFALVSAGLRQCVAIADTSGEQSAQRLAKLEKLFLSLA